MTDDLKELFKVSFSEEGCIAREKEEQAWIHFGDFLDECEGKKLTEFYPMFMQVKK